MLLDKIESDGIQFTDKNNNRIIPALTEHESEKLARYVLNTGPLNPLISKKLPLYIIHLFPYRTKTQKYKYSQIPVYKENIETKTKKRI